MPKGRRAAGAGTVTGPPIPPPEPAPGPPADSRGGTLPGRGDTSWAARYGQVILRDGIAAVPRALYLYQGALDLTAPEVWFVSAILAHKWDAALPHPSLRQMVEQTGVSLRQLQNLRAALCAKGHLEVRPRHDAGGGQATNSYDFRGLFSRLEAAILADPATPHAIQDVPTVLIPPGPEDGSFIARYGRLIARAGVIAVPAGLYSHQAALGLSPQECWFVTYILAYRWTADLPYPSLRKMATRTGYTEQRLHTIKHELETRGYLRIVPRQTPEGGQDTNAYDFSGLLDALTARLQQVPPPPPAAPAAPPPARHSRRGRAVVAAEEGVQSSRVGGAQSSRVGGVQSSREGGVQSRFATPGHAEDRGPGDAEKLSGPDAEHWREGDAENARDRDAENTRQRRSVKKEPDQKEVDSNRIARDSVGEPRPVYSPYVAGVVLDYSRELGDDDHGPANISQALRVWQESGLAEEAFIAHLHEARRRVRAYQGKQGRGFITNKMAYFFTVVRDLIGSDQNLT